MKQSKFALIDLGSNSLRLVVFDRARPFSAPLLNEKFIVELGRNFSSRGELSSDRIDAAIKVFHHFKWLLDGIGVKEIHILATAAVRDAKNAEALIHPVRTIMAADVRVLKGYQEAELAAKGVSLTCPGAQGVVADLGGGSLELAYLSADGVENAISLPLGVLRLEQLGLDQAKKALTEAIQDTSGLKNLGAIETLYLVGGTWRALARAHMAQISYDLDVIHRYEVDAKILRSYAKKLLKPSRELRGAFAHVSSSRQHKLSWAALVAACLIKGFSFKRIVFSQGGLREGYSISMLGREQELFEQQAQRYDRVIAALVPDGGRFGATGRELFDWMSPLFSQERGGLRDRRRQACQLFDFGWKAHPSYRKIDIPGAVVHETSLIQSHHDRIYLGLTLLLRHGGDLHDEQAYPWLSLTKIMSKSQHHHAIMVGRALRLAYRISRGIVPLVLNTQLEVDGPILRLKIENKNLWNLRVTYSSAFNRLAKSVGLQPDICVVP